MKIERPQQQKKGQGCPQKKKNVAMKDLITTSKGSKEKKKKTYGRDGEVLYLNPISREITVSESCVGKTHRGMGVKIDTAPKHGASPTNIPFTSPERATVVSSGPVAKGINTLKKPMTQARRRVNSTDCTQDNYVEKTQLKESPLKELAGEENENMPHSGVQRPSRTSPCRRKDFHLHLTESRQRSAGSKKPTKW